MPCTRQAISATELARRIGGARRGRCDRQIRLGIDEPPQTDEHAASIGYAVATPWLTPAAGEILAAMAGQQSDNTKRDSRVVAADRRAIERWVNEGGHVAAARHPVRRRVVIAGGGVAGLETLLALHALVKDRVDITIVEPELKFVNRSMAVLQPFEDHRVRGVRMQDVVDECGAHWLRRTVDRVEHAQRVAVTSDGIRLPYDALVLAIGARRPKRRWPPDGQLTFQGGRDGPDYRLLLHHLRTGRVDRLAFVRPPGPAWPLPLYDLALLTAADCADHGRSNVALSVVTPEPEPLGIFGTPVSAAIRKMLDDAGITLFASSVGEPSRSGWLDLSPGKRRIAVDRVVTEPRLTGPRLRGVPCDRDGFIHTDVYGQVPGLDGVFAAGDATVFPIKQGGLAAQQADVVAEVIASSVDPEICPQAFRPVLRGALRAGGVTRYLRADISGGAGDDSMISTKPLWWPPNKLFGRYLAPYLSRQADDALDVMPETISRFRSRSLLR
jgi:sulfide:quinone oxidoreductase